MVEPQDAASSAFTWTVHPVRTHHWRTILLVLIVAGTLALLWGWTRSLFWTGLALVVLLVAARQYLLPTTYTLDGTGATSRFLLVRRHKPWRQIRSFYRDGNGVLLSPFPAPSRLESFRGMYVMFEGNGDRVMERVKAHMTARRTDASGGTDGTAP